MVFFNESSEQLLNSFKLMAFSRTEEAIVSDFDKVERQNMLEEATDECFSAEGEGLVMLAVLCLALKAHHAILETENTIVADSGPKDVRR